MSALEDLDLEKVESLLKGELQKEPQDLKSLSKNASKNSYSHRKKHYDRSRSREKSSKSNSKRNEKPKLREKSNSKSQEKEKNNNYAKYRPKYEKNEHFLKNEQKNEGKRGDLTCLVMNLSMTTIELDIFTFLTKKKVGKIRDIKLIKDAKNKKSKGVAYVEFYDKESVENAISLTGSILRGNEIKIQPSQAEKNRMGISNKPMNKFGKNQQNNSSESPENLGSKRIYVGGLTDHLAELKEQDIKELFSSFGEVDCVVIHRDIQTGKSKGYAFVQFKEANDAKEAVEKMDGMLIANKTLKVSSVQSNLAGTINSFNNYANSESLDLDDESGHNFLHNSQSRSLLMQKLTRANNGGALVNSKGKADEISQTPTNSLLFVNMYTQEDLLNYKNFLSEMKTQLTEECKKFGEIKYIFIDPEIEGNIWVKFMEIQASINTQKSLNDRFFAGKKMTIYFVKEECFKKKFSV